MAAMRWSRLAWSMLAVIVPLLPLGLVSLSLLRGWPAIVQGEPDGSAWLEILSNRTTWEALVNGLLLAFAVALVNALLAIPAADSLARYAFRWRRRLSVLLYAPFVIPVFVALLGLHIQYLRWDLAGTWLAVGLAHIPLTLPYMLRALMVSYRTLGFEWEEQARMLGAGRWRRFRHVVLPHIKPGLASGLALTVLVSLSQYLLTLIIGGGQTQTFALLFFPFANGANPAYAAVYALLFAASAAFGLWLLGVTLRVASWGLR